MKVMVDCQKKGLHLAIIETMQLKTNSHNSFINFLLYSSTFKGKAQ